jgi:hypothetical protein
MTGEPTDEKSFTAGFAALTDDELNETTETSAKMAVRAIFLIMI